MNRIVVIFALAALLSACKTISTVRHELESTGIPYHLPKAVMALEIEVLRDEQKEFQDVKFSLVPKYVPDEDALLYLKPNYNDLYTLDHNLQLKNGLLNTVTTIEDGKAGEFATSLISSGLNFYTAQAGFDVLGASQSATENIFLNDNKVPTSAEIAYAMGLIQGDKLAFNYRPEKLAEFDIPGTNGLLSLKSGVNEILGASVQSGVVSGFSQRYANVENECVVPEPTGICARTVKSVEAHMSLYLDPAKLQEIRNEEIAKEIEFQNKNLVTLNKDLASEGRKRNLACGAEQGSGENKEYEVIKTNQAKIKELTEEVARLNKAKMILASDTDRLEVLNDQLKTLTDQIDALKAGITACNTADAAYLVAEKAKTSVEDTVSKYQKLDPCALLNKDISTDGKVVCKQDAEPFLVKQNSDVVLIPDTSRVVKIPVRRAWMGKTTNTLTFADGVLTGFHTQQPSAVMEVGNSLNNVANAVVALPAEIIQLKIDLTGQQTNLMQKQLDLENKIVELSQVGQEEETDEELSSLQREKELLEAQKEVDELKRDIASITAEIAAIEAGEIPDAVE